MAKKIDRKLALKKQTLRQISNGELRNVAGGIASGYICIGADASGKCGSTTIDFDSRVVEDGLSR